MVLIGSNKDGKAYDLREKIKEYKEYLISFVDENNIV
jgi:hypothetical protein